MILSNTTKIVMGIIIILLLFAGGYFTGRASKKEIAKPITVEIPEHSGSSPVINNPTPTIGVRDSLIYKDKIFTVENPFNEKLAREYADLDKTFTGLELEYKKMEAYLKSIQVRKYQIPIENERLITLNNIEVQGELLSFQQDFTIKKFSTEVDIPVESKWEFLGGATIGNTVKLDKFNANAVIGLQRPSGDIILTTYSPFDKSIQIGYLFKF